MTDSGLFSSASTQAVVPETVSPCLKVASNKVNLPPVRLVPNHSISLTAWTFFQLSQEHFCKIYILPLYLPGIVQHQVQVPELAQVKH